MSGVVTVRDNGSGPTVGLALGMGGARGWCHLGVLAELAEMGVAIDRIAGCSMGALVGAAWATGRLGALEDWARSLTRTRMLGYMDFRPSGGGLIGGGEIIKLLERLEITGNIEDLPRPYRALATDLESGREVWFDHGPLIDAVRASIAMPGVLHPARHQGRWLVDGALVDPIPVMGCRTMGVGPVIAVDPNGYGSETFWTPKDVPQSLTSTLMSQVRSLGGVTDWFSWGGAAEAGEGIAAEAEPARRAAPPNYVEVLSVSWDILIAGVLRMRLAASPPEVLIRVPLRGMNVLELDRAEEAIEAGRAATREKADEITALMARLGH